MNMHTRRITKTALALLAVGAISFAPFLGCRGGSTSGGPGEDDAGVGTSFVSDGGAGATIRIDVDDDLEVAGTTEFRVTLTDPQGAPLEFIRIFCESESGIAILEPSAGGVAFESTSARGIMSGVLGGVTPGSYLLECRAEQGFNLTARTSIRVTGDVPPGFEGFPGAAGGNLGGGLLVEDPNVDVEAGAVTITAISFSDVGGDGLRIDVVQDGDCDNDASTVDPEPFLLNDYKITVANGLEDALEVRSVTFSVNGATSRQEFAANIAAGGATTINGLFIDTPNGGVKQFAASSVNVVEGTFDVDFTVSLQNIVTGETFTLRDSQTFSADNIDNC
jgi:hypothetical protein